jgi:hypothetical protein
VRARLILDEPLLTGWGTARVALEKCERRAFRDELAKLVARSDIQGGSGLKFLAQLMLWHLYEADKRPSPPGKLKPYESAKIEERASELLASSELLSRYQR